MNCSRGDVILLPIPFTDLSSRKVRPAVVIGFGSLRSDLFVVPLTSLLSHVAFILAEWQRAGLNVASGVKAQLATVDAALALKVVGRLSAADAATLHAHLRQWLAW